MATHILLVDDDEADRYACDRGLAHHGFAVTSIASSMQALDLLQQGGRFDVLVTDLRLEKGEPHGLALANMIRSRWPGTPVIFVTAYPELLADDEARERILRKPIPIDALAAEIRAALAGAAEPTPD
jgi:CheY-like chemotaxis protein